MKTAAVFALRALVLTLVLIIVFMIAVSVSGVAQAPLPSAQAAPTPATRAQQAASLLGPLLAYTFLVSLVTAWIIQRSRWRGLKLITALIFTLYGLMTFISQIESIGLLARENAARAD
jgi:membrane protease YdiL (CAAX protease family)